MTDDDCHEVMPRPDWLAPLNDPRNEQILSAAFDLFVEKGFSSVTMTEVAAHARVSKETLYDRFDSKEGLLYALLAWGVRQRPWETEMTEEALAADPVGALKQAAVQKLTVMTREESLAIYRMMVSEGRRMPEVVKVYDEFTCGVGRAAAVQVGRALKAARVIAIEDLNEFAAVFSALIPGELHHEVAIGLRPIPTEAEIVSWVETATARLLRAYAPS